MAPPLADPRVTMSNAGHMSVSQLGFCPWDTLGLLPAPPSTTSMATVRGGYIASSRVLHANSGDRRGSNFGNAAADPRSTLPQQVQVANAYEWLRTPGNEELAWRYRGGYRSTWNPRGHGDALLAPVPGYPTAADPLPGGRPNTPPWVPGGPRGDPSRGSTEAPIEVSSDSEEEDDDALDLDEDSDPVRRAHAGPGFDDDGWQRHNPDDLADDPDPIVLSDGSEEPPRPPTRRRRPPPGRSTSPVEPWTPRHRPQRSWGDPPATPSSSSPAFASASRSGPRRGLSAASALPVRAPRPPPNPSSSPSPAGPGAAQHQPPPPRARRRRRRRGVGADPAVPQHHHGRYSVGNLTLRAGRQHAIVVGSVPPLTGAPRTLEDGTRVQYVVVASLDRGNRVSFRLRNHDLDGRILVDVGRANSISLEQFHARNGSLHGPFVGMAADDIRAWLRAFFGPDDHTDESDGGGLAINAPLGPRDPSGDDGRGGSSPGSGPGPGAIWIG